MSPPPITADTDPAPGPDAGELRRWGLFAASLLGLALLVGWSARHPVPGIAPGVAVSDAVAPVEAVPVVPAPEAGASGAVAPETASVGDPAPDAAAAPEVARAPAGRVAAIVVGPGEAADAPPRDAPPRDAAQRSPVAPALAGGAGGDLPIDGPPAPGAGGPEGAAASAERPPRTPAERRAEELAVLVGLSARLRYSPGETFPGATGAEALERMAEPLARYPGLDVIVSVTGSELGEPARDAALARERAGRVIDRLVALGLDRGRFLLRLRPEVPGPTPGQHVRVTAVTEAG